MSLNKCYEPLPKEDLFDLPEADNDCIVCWGDGDVQCCSGEYYYTDTCNCVLTKYWEKKGNSWMADGHKKLLERTIYYKTL